MQKLVHQLLEALKTQKGTAEHQQRRYQPGHEKTDRKGRRHQDGLVDHGAAGNREDHWQFPGRLYTGHLLGVERQIIPQNTCGFLGGGFCHQGNIVQNGGDVIDQNQKAASCHWTIPFLFSR